eukprot:752123-Hanusia_phi.AAC.7
MHLIAMMLSGRVPANTLCNKLTPSKRIGRTMSFPGVPAGHPNGGGQGSDANCKARSENEDIRVSSLVSEEKEKEQENVKVGTREGEDRRRGDVMRLMLLHRHFLAISLPIERKFSRGLRDHEFLITTDDTQLDASMERKDVFPLVVILDNLRSAFNVGSIFRTSECLGIESIVKFSDVHTVLLIVSQILCGYTSTPEDSQTSKSAMGMDKVCNTCSVECKSGTRDRLCHGSGSRP